MHPNDPVSLSIRNHRPSRLTGPLILFGLGCLLAGLGGAWQIGLLDGLPAPAGVFLAALAIISCGVLSLTLTFHPVRHWKLGQALVAWPGREYQPGDIREVAFAPDPAEDYDDSATPARRCEVRARLRRRGELRLIASVGDARRVRDWAVRWGIAVSETGQVLDGPGGGP